MTGPEHYREATAWAETAAREFHNRSPETATVAARIAQVHATAALAAATVTARRGRDVDARVWARQLYPSPR